MSALVRVCALVGTLVLFLAPMGAKADDTAPPAQVAWRMLDYLAVDYAGAVDDAGKVKSASEFSEMNEFSANVRTKIAGLPPTSAKPTLIQEADALKAAIAARSPPPKVATQAHKLAADLLAAYPTPVAPAHAPDLVRGMKLYQETCSGCHGAAGRGDGPDAVGLDPPPIAFTDAVRARQRSLFGLYQVISQGLDGTAMQSYGDLPSDDRWALAFTVGGFAFGPDEAARGERIWKADPSVRASAPDMQALTQTSPQQLEASLGRDRAYAMVAYLRHHPEAVVQTGAGSLSVARAKLQASLAAYQAGDKAKASDLALAAYLDGFEPVEPALTAHDPALMRRVEGAMGGFRAAISHGAAPSEVQAQADRISALLDAAERALGPGKADAGASFAGAMTILLREGLEALLIVVAMIAFLRKAERSDALPYVHVGWAGALVAGGLTWAAATWLISISGASRELTEGFGSIIAAVVLVSVGVWMHGKSKGQAWQAYIHEKMSKAMTKRSAWFLFLLAFVVVYREVFETILFYAALWSQGAHAAIIGGALTAILALAAIAWALLGYSKRLPIGKFFAYSSILIAILAVVLAGKGVSALQETGLIDIRPLADVPRIELLGIYPTLQTVLGQFVTAAALVLGFWLTGRERPAAR